MTVETKNEISPKSPAQNWAPKARRQGEAGGWGQTRPAEPAQTAIAFPALSASPLQWPRLFPGL